MPGPRVGLIRPGPRLGLRRDLSTVYVSPASGGFTLGGFSPSFSGSTPPFVPDFFISPTGGSGTGSLTDPWSLSYALGGGGGQVAPNEQGAMRGGAYNGSFTSSLNGTAVNPIIIRQFPGERATINGNLSVFGSYTWLWGFEIVSPTPGSGQVNGLQGRSTGSKYINLVVHDAAGVGITLFDDIGGSGAKPDQEAYGCLSYNNGNTNNLNHGFYSNNVSGYRKLRDCICFNNWALGVQSYGSADNVHNVTFDGNISFNNGSISGYAGGPNDLFIGGPTVTGAVVTNNAVFRVDHGSGAFNLGYYFGPVNQDLVCTGNYVYGLSEIFDWATAVVSGNTFRANASGAYVVGAGGITGNRGNLSGHTWNSNTWYDDPTLAQWGYGPTGQVPGNAYTYAQWLAQTGFANPGSVVNATPPNFVQVRPNFYEPGRGNIAIYNWSGASTVAVDLSSILSAGQTYTVVNAQDYFGAPVVSGIYAGGTVSLPMAGIAAPAPIGRGVAGPTTGPTFQAFVVRPQGA